MPQPPIRIVITSTFEQAAALAEQVRRLCAAVPGCDAEAADALRLCLVEALNNIIEHAYDRAPDRPIEAEIRPTGDGCEVLLVDEGRPMPGDRAPDPAVDFDPSDTGALPEGGFGWMLIRAQMDGVDYRRQDGRNLLRLSKRLVLPAIDAPAMDVAAMDGPAAPAGAGEPVQPTRGDRP